jgi:hypothetical protein
MRHWKWADAVPAVLRCVLVAACSGGCDRGVARGNREAGAGSLWSGFYTVMMRAAGADLSATRRPG